MGSLFLSQGEGKSPRQVKFPESSTSQTEPSNGWSPFPSEFPMFGPDESLKAGVQTSLSCYGLATSEEGGKNIRPR